MAKWIKFNVLRADGKGADDTVINFDQVSAIRKAVSGGAVLVFGFMPAGVPVNPLEIVTTDLYDDVLKKVL